MSNFLYDAPTGRIILDKAKLTTVNLAQTTRDYLDNRREPYRFSLSYMVNLIIQQHAQDRDTEYNLISPAHRGRPRVRPEKKEWEGDSATPGSRYWGGYRDTAQNSSKSEPFNGWHIAVDLL